MLSIVCFTAKNEWGNVFADIFGEYISAYENWRLLDGEITIKDNENFDNVSREDFSNMLLANDDYYVVNCAVIGGNCSGENINVSTMQDFIQSKYEVLFIITDSVYCELYMKNLRDAEKIYNGLLKKKFSDITFSPKAVPERDTMGI